MSCCAAFASLAEDLLFYAPFDGDATARFARGKAEATHALEPIFAPGLRGQALRIGGDLQAGQRIVDGIPDAEKRPLNSVYASDGNIDLQQGTLCFWVKPLDWSGDAEHFNVLFYTHTGKNYFQVYKFFSTDQMLFLRGEMSKWTSTYHRARDWKPGVWQHVAVSWSPEEMTMVLNGHLVCRRRVRFPFEVTTPVEPFSVGPGGDWSKAFAGHSLVDEFRIYRRPLAVEEIQRLYLADAAAVEHDSGLITLGERTPVQEGRIEENSYAFDSTGLDHATQALVSPERSRYALSYDRETLYVAALTECQGDAEAVAAERLDVYLSPSPERMPAFSFSPDGSITDPHSGAAKTFPDGVVPRVRNTLSEGLWLLEAAIPFAALDQPTAPDGQSWRMNLVRRYASLGESVSLAKVAGSMTNRAHFIALAFRPDAPVIRIADWADLEKRQNAQIVEARPAREDVDLRLETIQDTMEAYGLRSSAYTLYSQGEATPYRSTVWSTGAGRDFNLSERRIMEVLDGVTTPLYYRKTITESADPLRVFHLYTHASKQLVVSAQRRTEGRIRARFLRLDGSEAFRSERPLPSDSSYFTATFDLDFDALTPDEYTVCIEFVPPQGDAVETWQQAYRVPGRDHPAFHPYVDPEADQVPAPWTPVEVSGQWAGGSGQEAVGSSKTRISTWGRTYGFCEGILFDSLVSQDEEVLAAPALLRLDGQALAPVAPVTSVAGEATEMQAALTRRADLGALQVESRIKVHFDGYCEVEMTVAPGGAEAREIQSLTFDIPLRGDAALLVRDAKISPLVGSKSGAVGDAWHQGFETARDRQDRAFLWVGNDRVGFNWMAPDRDAWHSRKTDRQVELVRDGEIVLLRFNWVDAPLTLDAPRVFRFAFLLTPSRPLDRKILRRREHKEYQMWCQPWACFAVPDYDRADVGIIRNALTRVEPGADEVFLYLGVGLTSPFSAEWPWFVEEWLGPEGEYGKWTGSFRDRMLRDRNTYVVAPITGGVDSFFNWMQHTRAAFFEKARTPLIPEAHSYYFDTGPSVSARCREQALNVYRMIRRTGPKARIYAHQGWTRAMPFQHFSDIICGGEGVGATLSQESNYYGLLTPELFRASFSPYLWGIKMVFLDMSVRMLKEGNPDLLLAFDLDDPAYRRPLLHVYGYCVVHDVDIHDPNEQSKPLRDAIWAAQDALEWDEDVIFHPYWENDAVRLVRPDNHRIMASAYTKGGRMLLAVVNDTDEAQEIELALDLDKLGCAAGAEAADTWEPEKRYTLGRVWRDSVPARGFRMIQWSSD